MTPFAGPDTSKTMRAAILATIILSSANAGLSAEHSQSPDLSIQPRRGPIPFAVGSIASNFDATLRAGYWQNRFSRISIFEPPDFLADFFSCRFLPHFVRSRPSKPNQKKGRNEKSMNFAHFIELLFRNAPQKSSWTGLFLPWFAGATPDFAKCPGKVLQENPWQNLPEFIE